MDAVDKAKELEQAQRQKGIKKARCALLQNGTPNCTDCKKPIPPARRQAYPAARRCIDCQTTAEACGHG